VCVRESECVCVCVCVRVCVCVCERERDGFTHGTLRQATNTHTRAHARTHTRPIIQQAVASEMYGKQF
jgi:hypothetical protein